MVANNNSSRKSNKKERLSCLASSTETHEWRDIPQNRVQRPRGQMTTLTHISRQNETEKNSNMCTCTSAAHQSDSLRNDVSDSCEHILANLIVATFPQEVVLTIMASICCSTKIGRVVQGVLSLVTEIGVATVLLNLLTYLFGAERAKSW